MNYTVILLGDEGHLQAIRVSVDDRSKASILARKMSLDAWIAENYPARGEETDAVVDEWESFYRDFLLIEGHPDIKLDNDDYTLRFLGEPNA